MVTRQQVAVRLDLETLARLDAYAEALRDQTGLEVSRSDVIRKLIAEGLDAAGAKKGRKPRGRKKADAE